MTDTLFGFEIKPYLKLRDRALRVHGKVCAVETRGPKHSLVMSCYREHNGRTYEIRRGAGARGQRIFKIFVPTWGWEQG